MLAHTNTAAVHTAKVISRRVMKCPAERCWGGCPHQDVHLERQDCREHGCQQIKLRGKALGGRLAG